ncbi:LIPT2 family protein [Megaselia abdita]
MRRPIVKVLTLGKLHYRKSLELQKTLSTQQIESFNDFRNYLILNEHNPVYTIGIRRNSYSHEEREKLRNVGAEFYETNRGGLITFHGPGQLVAYPIIHLKQFQPSMRWYVRQLETTIIDLCQMFNLSAKTTSDTGIWIGENKICAIGIHGKRYVTTHGIGLNCNTDLKWFDHIVPCGIEGKGVTSLSKELNKNVSVAETIPLFLNSFSKNFNCSLEFLKI